MYAAIKTIREAASAASQAGQSGYVPSRRDLADCVVVSVGHINAARPVHRHAIRIIKAYGVARAIDASSAAG